MAGAPFDRMATRMTTLLLGSMRGPIETPPMPINAPASRVPAGENQVSVADTELMTAQSMASLTPSTPAPAPRWDNALPSIPPAFAKRSLPAFPAMTVGLLSTAVLWLGLALFVVAAAYPMSDFARAALTLIGSTMMAAVIAFTMSRRPEYA
jgi:hypothetical protein